MDLLDINDRVYPDIHSGNIVYNSATHEFRFIDVMDIITKEQYNKDNGVKGTPKNTLYIQQILDVLYDIIMPMLSEETLGPLLDNISDQNITIKEAKEQYDAIIKTLYP